jgi:hypothetical protein
LIRACSDHLKLLVAWRERLRSRQYLSAQEKPFLTRPLGLRSDQDVLTALLGSSMFSDIDYHLLREGTEIAQCALSVGFRSWDRVRTLWRGIPPLVHSQGPKPWEKTRSISTELSPYCSVASEYADAIDASLAWTKPGRRVSRILDKLFLGHPSLRGLPITLLRETQLLGCRTLGNQV